MILVEKRNTFSVNKLSAETMDDHAIEILKICGYSIDHSLSKPGNVHKLSNSSDYLQK